MRTLSTANQGQHFHDTPEAAAEYLKVFTENNSEDILRQVFGYDAIGTFQIRPVECWENGDAKGIYFDDPDAPFDKKHKNLLNR